MLEKRYKNIKRQKGDNQPGRTFRDLKGGLHVVPTKLNVPTGPPGSSRGKPAGQQKG